VCDERALHQIIEYGKQDFADTWLAFQMRQL